MTEYKRNCPECNKELIYARKDILARAYRINGVCNKCAIHPAGIKHSEEAKEKCRISKLGAKNPNYGKKMSEEQKQKISDAVTGYKHTEETKRKLSIAARKRIENSPNQNFSRYNSSSIPIIEQYGKDHGYNFQHAENGGEAHILRYWVDGYDKNKNVVIEYYEKSHNRKSRIDKDDRRKQEIIDHLECEFIEIKEWDND